LEPWATLIFIFLVPIFIQVIKFVADKKGKEVAAYVAQAISVITAGIYVLASGGFAGLLVPIFPAWGGDIVGYGVGFLTWAADWLRILMLSAGAIEVAYRLVLKALMEKVSFATTAALAKRASAGP
jgi:hypothetical protein